MGKAITVAELTTEFSTCSTGRPRLFRAPGRVNIVGDHTDYNEGLALPTTTAAYTWLAASGRDDRTVHVTSGNLNDRRTFELDDLAPSANPEWIDYVKGVAAQLEADGVRLRGADIFIGSEIPIGGGLSSSAALEVAAAKTLLALADADLPPVRIAQLCQRAEIQFAGLSCGIMDHFAIACGERGKALLLDCRSLVARQVPIPPNARILITDSGLKRVLPAGEYNSRARECAEAVDRLSAHTPGIVSLRDLKPDTLEKSRELLGDTLYRRCRHVVTENRRVEDAFTALHERDLEILGSLISESHASLRDDFEVSCDEVESLIGIADSCAGVLGSRSMGAGFGGCVLSLTEADKIGDVMHQVGRGYGRVIGRDPWMHVVQPAHPAQAVAEP